MPTPARTSIEGGSNHDEKAVLRQQLRRAHAELEKVANASSPLQEMVDALAAMPDLDEFIPAVLRITARALNSLHCSYFEHRGDGSIRLSYWFMNGVVLSRNEILRLEHDHSALLKSLAEGFVNPNPSGRPLSTRTRASVKDRGRDESTQALDRYRRSQGCYAELSVPLFVAGKAEGTLVLAREAGALYSPAEIALAKGLVQHLALALEVNRLSAKAKDISPAREEEKPTQSRLNEVEQSSRALQETIDALAGMPDLDQFIPAALRIAARAFDTGHCSYFEHRDDDPIQLKYWFLDGRVLTREEVLVFGDEHMKRLATGFTVDDSYFGEPLRTRFRPNVVDHGDESRTSEIDLNCRSRGWYFELNIPLVVAGRSEGVLVVQRGPGMPYSAAEVALGMRLGQHLALAMEVSRLSAFAKHAAIAHERERAALERADETTRFSGALRKTLDCLVCESDFPGFVGRLLANASEQLQAPVVEYWRTGEAETATLAVTCRDGLIFQGSDIENDVRTRGIKVFPEVTGAATLDAMSTPFLCEDLVNDPWQDVLYAGTDFSVRRWCQERGVTKYINLPLVSGERCFGAVLIYFPKERHFDQAKIDLAHSFAQQLALSVRLTQLAEESKQAAVLRERESAVQARAAETAKANAVMRATLDQLAANRDLLSFPRTILQEAMKQLKAQDGIIMVVDSQTNELRVSEIIAPGGSPEDIPEVMALAIPIDEIPAWPSLVSKRDVVVLDVEQDAAMLLPGAPAWLKRRGNKSAIAALLFSGDAPYGYFGIGLRECAAEVSKVNLGLVQALTQQANLAIQLTQMAAASQQTAIALERQHVIIQEREHLSREIHDRLTQGYAAILMQQHAIRRSLKTAPKSLTQHLDIIERLSKDNLAEARKTMADLRVDPLGPSDLQRALENCIQQFDGKYPVDIVLKIKDELPLVPHYLQIELCRVVGESLTNACKHSRANSIKVTVQCIEERISILVEDDGVGFDVESKSPSFGIDSMYERAARAAAELTIHSTFGGGTQVRLTLRL